MEDWLVTMLKELVFQRLSTLGTLHGYYNKLRIASSFQDRMQIGLPMMLFKP
jgi:hypothetical protein